MSEEQSVLVQPENITADNGAIAQAPTPSIPATPAQPQASPIAIKSIPAHYLVTVRGQAAITGGTNPESVVYEETIACPDLGEGKADGHYMTYLLKDDLSGDGILANALKKKYGHCEAIRTHELTNRVYVNSNGEQAKVQNITIVNGQQFLQVSQMRYNELVDYVNERKYQISLELYPSADELRFAIDAYEKDKDAFVLVQEKTREDFRIKKDAEALAALNKPQGTLDI